MVDGLFIWEHINTTDARAKVAQGEAERLIALAIRGHRRAWAHLNNAVPDSEAAEKVLALARRARFSLDESIPSNEERAQEGKYPLGPEARKRKEDRLAAFKKEMLGIIKDHDEAQRALTAAREAMAIELHARRTILKHLPRETTVKKIFEQCRVIPDARAATRVSPSWVPGAAMARISSGSTWSSLGLVLV